MGKENKNYAFVDGQNLHMGTAKREVDPWKIDLAHFRVYLEQKYNVGTAYYFLGFVQDELQDVYEEIQKAGFILQFKKHNPAMIGIKKGNVDTDMVFHVMKKLYKKEPFDKIILVSGDGDYRMLVDFLIEEERFEKILFPDGVRASSLYKKVTRKYFDDLGKADVRAKIGKRKGALGN